MDRDKALEQAASLVGTMMPAEGVALEDALSRSVIPDAAGRWPQDAAWVASYDPYWLAAEVVERVFTASLTEGVVTSWQSEGTTFNATPADLQLMAARLRGQSQIGAMARDSLHYIDVERGPDLGLTPRSLVLGNWD